MKLNHKYINAILVLYTLSNIYVIVFLCKHSKIQIRLRLKVYPNPTVMTQLQTLYAILDLLQQHLIQQKGRAEIGMLKVLLTHPNFQLHIFHP